jgi:archaellum component FlaF (FlaF/FlaG flagellin family)
MLKRLFGNRKGTAEVIGSVMFIVILLFFFTNVYLWHDAATKEMNELYVDKINTPVALSVSQSESTVTLQVTNKGGSDTTISMVWVIIGSGAGQRHYNYTSGVPVPAGKAVPVMSLSAPTTQTMYKVVTTTGNTASFSIP